jgi:hypothetical protein
MAVCTFCENNAEKMKNPLFLTGNHGIMDRISLYPAAQNVKENMHVYKGYWY